jgi:hypothetical protein
VWIRLCLGALTALALAACGHVRTSDPGTASQLCETAPEEHAVYANPDVAFAWEAGVPEGGELQSGRSGGGELPWFAKTGIHLHGRESIVVRVPLSHQDVVRISGWYGPGSDGELRTDVLVEPADGCGDWTAYPGGLAFEGRQCVRLRIEGPGDRTGSVLIGLRRDCSH